MSWLRSHITLLHVDVIDDHVPCWTRMLYVRLNIYKYGVRQRRMQRFVIFVHLCLIKIVPHFYGFCWIWNSCTFCQTRHNSANTPHFHGTRRHNTAKGASILGLRHFKRRCIVARPIKCCVFGERKAAQMPPCFQGLLQHICCILFDVYHINQRGTTLNPLGSSLRS